MNRFEELGVRPKVARSMEKLGWTEPTPIQEMGIPIGISGKDLFGQAPTGTGKTGAFASVVLSRIPAGSDIPSCLILVPTRELAAQVTKVVIALSENTKHRVLAVYGGTRYDRQIRFLEDGCDIVVGTPSRIIDLVDRQALHLEAARELVVDEADRMMDMGFSDDLLKIVGYLPSKRHSMMFSATVSEETDDLVERIMNDPSRVSLESQDEEEPLTRQYFVETPRKEKIEFLRTIISNGNPKTMVFCSTKAMVDSLYETLSQDELKVGAIHGEMPQIRREKTLRGFRNDRMQILISTDVAARGIDVDNVECVINYDAPLNPEDYVHRVGRVGRAGREGTAVTFVTPKETFRIRKYEEYTGVGIEKVPHKKVKSLHVSNQELKELHGETKPAEGGTRPSTGPVKGIEFGTVSIDMGKKNGIDRNDIVKFVVKHAGISDDRIGHIGMSSDRSFIDIDETCIREAMGRMQKRKLKGHPVKVETAPSKKKDKDKKKRYRGGSIVAFSTCRIIYPTRDILRCR
ncbi:MAG: DEAD/DEAH box helicase [Candidatus Methanomethylophilaceae archaeon]|nr:DEAD/DEAH box helicase [Candidatus Methanomethylophilaceae archaeon]